MEEGAPTRRNNSGCGPTAPVSVGHQLRCVPLPDQAKTCRTACRTTLAGHGKGPRSTCLTTSNVPDHVPDRGWSGGLVTQMKALRPADDDFGAPTARRHCSGAWGGDSGGVNGSYELG